MNQTRSLLLVITMLMLNACNSTKSEAEKQAELIQKTVKENTPGTIPTSETGYYMKAKFDGKEWTASHMMPDDDVSSSYKMISGENAGEFISFQLWKRGVAVGKKIVFSEDHAANLSIDDVPGYLGGKSGEVEITKMDEQWMEGIFHFTATTSSSDKKVEVTDGRFRVALVPGLK